MLSLYLSSLWDGKISAERVPSMCSSKGSNPAWCMLHVCNTCRLAGIKVYQEQEDGRYSTVQPLFHTLFLLLQSVNYIYIAHLLKCLTSASYTDLPLLFYF